MGRRKGSHENERRTRSYQGARPTDGQASSPWARHAAVVTGICGSGIGHQVVIGAFHVRGDRELTLLRLHRGGWDVLLLEGTEHMLEERL